MLKGSFVDEQIEYFKSREHLWTSKGLDVRVGKVSGRHDYEICLKTLLKQVNKSESNRTGVTEAVSFWRRRLLVSIIKACLDIGVSPEKHIGQGHGYIVVRPNVNSSIYLEYIALSIQLLPPWEVRPFLDFQLVHCHSGSASGANVSSKLRSGLSDSGFEFLRGLNHSTRHICHEFSVSDGNEAAEALCQWLTLQYDRMTFRELSKLHSYEWKEAATLRVLPGRENVKHGSTTTINPGCSIPYLQAFFSLFERRPAGQKVGKYYVEPKRVRYILNKYFGVGEPVEFDPSIEPLVDRNQLCWFAMEFTKHRPHRKTGCLTTQQLLEILYIELPEVFGRVAKSTIVSNYKTYAASADLRQLNWTSFPEVRTVVEKEKNL